jgi:hypothetical protein
MKWIAQFGSAPLRAKLLGGSEDIGDAVDIFNDSLGQLINHLITHVRVADQLYPVIDRRNLIIHPFEMVGTIVERSKLGVVFNVFFPILLLPGNNPDLVGGRDHFGQPICQEGDVNFSIL